MKIQNKHTGMYFEKKPLKEYVEHQQNPSNIAVAQILERISLQELKQFSRPWYISELGAGARTDRYNLLFNELLKEPKGQIDWVDFSPLMIELAKKYLQQNPEMKQVINFVENDAFNYLQQLENTKYYYSKKTIERLAKKQGFEVFIGDWKNYAINKQGINKDQDILVLKKK